VVQISSITVAFSMYLKTDCCLLTQVNSSFIFVSSFECMHMFEEVIQKTFLFV
jgi:hypothetical protein